MLNMQVIIAKLQKENVTSQILNDLIMDHLPQHDKMISNYQRYKASKTPDGVPVFSRKFDDENKINRKLNDAFDVDIIDVKLGYMIGNPVIYEMDKTKYGEGDKFSEGEYKLDKAVIDDFNSRNNAEDIDGETLKMASICGYGARLLYVDKDGQTRAMNVDPWECIFITDGSINEAQYALRYYEMMDNGKKRIYVEWYDQTTIYYYITSDDVNNRVKDAPLTFVSYDDKKPEPHLFNGVPLIQFANNKEFQGDCDKVYESIDAYDRTISDIDSEMEQFRLAYMAFYGMEPSEETIKKAKRSGAFGMPDPESKIEFITKELNDAVIEHHLDRLEENIYKFASSINFKDKAFTGNQTVIEMKLKMFKLESKCIMCERKFTTALKTQYKILATNWAVSSRKIDYTWITFTWTRNFPLNLADEATTTKDLKGLVSEKTRLGLLSFIDDPEKEMKQMEEDNVGIVDDLDKPELDEDGNPVVKGAAKNEVL